VAARATADRLGTGGKAQICPYGGLVSASINVQDNSNARPCRTFLGMKGHSSIANEMNFHR
jgi:hypothetical protein